MSNPFNILLPEFKNLLPTPKRFFKRKFKIALKIISIICSLAFVISIGYLTYRISGKNSNNIGNINQSKAVTIPTSITKKVLVLNFDPLINGSTPLHTYKNWNDPIALQDLYISDIKYASHNQVNYQVVQTQTIRDYPTKLSGYKFNQTDYLNCLTNTTPTYCNEMIDYNKLLTDYNICGQVNAGTIDEVWLWGAPYFGYNETKMAGPGAFDVNGGPILNTTCNRKVIISGYNYERTNAEMTHNFIHRTEAIMVKLLNGHYPYSSTTYDLTNVWDRYWLYNTLAPGYASCGSNHKPPNSAPGNFGDKTYIPIRCEDWLNYPSTTGKTIDTNCTAWDCIEANQLRPVYSNYFEKYWLYHLPLKTGTTDNILNNWWYYSLDYDTASAAAPNEKERWYSVHNGTSDSNTSCSTTVTNGNEIYLGINSGCTTNNNYTATLSFQNVQIPKNVYITNAYLEVVADGTYTNQLVENISLSDGTTTTSPVQWNIADSWTTQTLKQSPNFSNTMQQLINSSSWVSGKNITLMLNHVSGSGSRRFFAFEREANAGARLVIVYQNTAPTPAPTTVSFSVTNGTDDYNINCDSTLLTGNNYLTVGARPECAEQPRQFADIGFKNVTIPAFSTISDAHLEVTSNGSYSNNFTLYEHIYTEGGGNSFSSEWPITTNWNSGTSYSSNNFASYLQSALNSHEWISGREVLIRLVFKDGSGSGTRQIKSFESGYSPKLVVTYTAPVVTPTISPTPAPPPNSSCYNLTDQTGKVYHDNWFLNLAANTTYIFTPTNITGATDSYILTTGSTSYFQMFNNDGSYIPPSMTGTLPSIPYPGKFTIKTLNTNVKWTDFVLAGRPSGCKAYINFSISGGSGAFMAAMPYLAPEPSPSPTPTPLPTATPTPTCVRTCTKVTECKQASSCSGSRGSSCGTDRYGRTKYNCTYTQCTTTCY